MLWYTPTNQKQDGTWRSVSVLAGSNDYVVTTRDGYFAPEPPPVKPFLEFTVTDQQQALVDATRDDFVVLEDGVEQTVDTFQIAVDPIQIVMTLDESGSMRTAIADVKAAAREFVQALEPKDPLAVVTFSDKVLFAHDLTTTREWSFDAIDRYTAIGGTALYDALYESMMRLKVVEGRRAVIVLTDGRDENNPGTAPGSVHTLADVMGCLKDVDATIYAIGLGSQVDRPLLERLAETSGGRAFFRPTRRSFERSTATSSRICVAGTSSVTHPRMASVTAAGAMSRSGRDRARCRCTAVADISRRNSNNSRQNVARKCDATKVRSILRPMNHLHAPTASLIWRLVTSVEPEAQNDADRFAVGREVVGGFRAGSAVVAARRGTHHRGRDCGPQRLEHRGADSARRRAALSEPPCLAIGRRGGARRPAKPMCQ